MKQFLTGLKVGDSVVAEVIECTGEHDFIVNFHGDLIRVANRSSESLKPGQKVSLVVTAISPFSFKLSHSRQKIFERRV